MSGEFTIVREFDAPRALVFAAWTDPAQLGVWWGPKGFTARQVVRDGNRLRGQMVADDDGTAYPIVVNYRTVVEPELLEFAWGDPTDPDSLSDITVRFTESGGTTTMTFHLRAPGAFSPDDGAYGGWNSAFDRLAALTGISR